MSLKGIERSGSFVAKLCTRCYFGPPFTPVLEGKTAGLYKQTQKLLFPPKTQPEGCPQSSISGGTQGTAEAQGALGWADLRPSALIPISGVCSVFCIPFRGLEHKKPILHPEYAEHPVKSAIKCQMVTTAPYMAQKDTSDVSGFCILGREGEGISFALATQQGPRTLQLWVFKKSTQTAQD